MTVPGVGPIIASAIMAAIGNGAAFAQGRASLHGSAGAEADVDGDRTILGRISCRSLDLI